MLFQTRRRTESRTETHPTPLAFQSFAVTRKCRLKKFRPVQTNRAQFRKEYEPEALLAAYHFEATTICWAREGESYVVKSRVSFLVNVKPWLKLVKILCLEPEIPNRIRQLEGRAWHTVGPTHRVEFTDLETISKLSPQMVRQHNASSNGSLKFSMIAALVFLLLFSGLSISPSFAQDSKDDKEAWDLAEVAVNAQNANDFSTAQRKWQKLLDIYPDADAARSAWYNLANCHYNQEDYGSAIIAFKNALPNLRKDESPKIPEVLLALGYSRIREGRRLAPSDPEESNMQFSTAANDLNTIIKDFSNSNLAGAAAYQRGKALTALGQTENAKASYEKALEFKENNVRVECMFALGGISLREGEYEEASRWYDRLRTVVDKEKGHSLLPDTNLNYGDALINIGIQQLKKNDVDLANKKFTEAKTILAEVTGDESFELRDSAIFLDASSSMYLGNDAEAAELFESVSKMNSSELKDKARVLAGSSWLKAGNEKRGTEALQTAIDSASSYSVDAVHELALWLTGVGRGQEAFELTDKWSTKIDGHPLEVDILLDRANASRSVTGLADRSAGLYADIAKNFPNHPQAPYCLYQSAFSNFEDNDYDTAIAQAKTFAKSYPGDPLQPGMREVLGDSLLVKGEHREAEAVFRGLVTDFQSNKKDLSWWATRAGFASYLQSNFDETIDWLEKQDALITTPEHKAESLHWIGSSHYQKKQFKEASEKLRQSLDIDRKWSRTPEVMLTLCNSQLKLSQFEAAEETALTLMKGFPDNPDENVGRALYAVGVESMDAKEFERAIRNFDLLSNTFAKSELKPVAMYRSAYAAIESENSEDAAKRFAMFLKEYPQHELAQQARLAQTNALRISGDTDASIAGLKQLVADATDADTRHKANFQLGLAYVDGTDWANAVATFESMTEGLTAENLDADKVWYELAWAQQENGDADAALKSFAMLAENFPKSSSAPEANFLLGSSAYTAKEYDKAIEFYTTADSNSARDEIREKARYKLGWCHYKKGDFDTAGEQFKKQAEDFKDGNLYADGRYMIAQCAWRANDYKKAFQAYTVAKPVIEEYSQTDARVKKYTSPTLLNGAKAGNKTKNFVEAAKMATALIELPDATEAVKQEAQLELGIAKMALGQHEVAAKALDKAVSSDDLETGAHAKALLGDILFKQAVDAAKDGDTEASKKKFEEAVDAYSGVYYGYGGSLASAEVKSWQAYASYEAGRCYMVQINEAKDVDKVILTGKALDRYNYLLTRFPNHKLAKVAKESVAELEALKAKFAK